ncbi:MAG: hypothetical protein J5710_08830 [Treponema sp.]|nr:hypothetical protein [Treponema sp.]
MGNDNKIKQTNDQRHKEVLLFLNDELNRLQTVNSSNSYDLEKEYEKTRKNKSLFSTLLLTISLLVVFLSAWGITAYINTKNEEITVNLQEFEGLNVKNLLDSVSKVQANYDNAMKNKTNITSDRDVALRKAEEKRDSELFVIESLNLDDKKEVQKRKNAVLQEYNDSVEQINEYYEPQIVLADNELAEYKKQLDEYDTAKLEAARQQEQALDSERRVHRLEMEKLSKEYDERILALQESYAKERQDNSDQVRRQVSEVSQKYVQEINLLDPDLTLTSTQGIVNTINAQEYEAFDYEAFIDENEIEDDTLETGLALFQQNYNKFNAVQEPFESIPYKKSAPAYIQASKNLVNNMGTVFEETALKVTEEKQELNDKIDDLEQEVSGLNNQIEKIRRDSEAEKAALQQSLEAAFLQEKQQITQEYVGLYDGILASVKAAAVVVSANSKDSIRIYVVPEQRAHITEAGVGAEIKGTKTVKGIIKPIADDPGFYRFESALDKVGNPVDFDFSLVAPGQIVKVSAK